MSAFPGLNNISPINKESGMLNRSNINHNTSAISGDYDISRFFSYDLSELRSQFRNRSHKSYMAKRNSSNRLKNSDPPFHILNKKFASKGSKINVKMNKEGVEMINAMNRRKETQKQHDIIQNRIRRLQDLEKKENQQMEKIKSQMEKFNVIRKVQSEYMQKRNEVIEESKNVIESKKKEVKQFKEQIQSNIRQKRNEVLAKNRQLMEEVMRENDQIKLKRK